VYVTEWNASAQVEYRLSVSLYAILHPFSKKALLINLIWAMNEAWPYGACILSVSFCV